MAGNNVINYDIKFNADTSNITSQVNQLKTSFQELKTIANQKLADGGITNEQQQKYQQLLQTINAVDTAMTQAFNKDLGTLNVAKFNQSINSSVGGIQNVGNALNSVGVKGQQAFKKLATELLTVNHQLRQSGGFLASMAQTMANTIKWGVASSVMNNFTGTVKKAYGYVKHLDSSLNDIRIVTGKSSDEMDKFAVKANKVAQSLGQSTNAYTEAALIYYQQGLGDVDVEARANVTLKAANVTGQTGAEVSEQLTAVWNGYKVSAEESELYIDKLAAVAANSASNLEELSTGMSKVASAANAMGVDVDQLNAQLSTIISVTRQAPESVGTALKTIYARMSDLKLGKTDEDGIGLGDVSGTMESMGIDVLDATGNLRDMGDVIEDVAKKWGTWTEAQQTAMAQAMAGKRQYNNLVALFENWDMYERSKDVSEGSAGTLQKQQDTYMESTEAHLKQLKTEWEDLYDSLIDTDSINGVVDGLTKVVNLMGAWVDGIGGGTNLLLLLGSTAMNVFSRQIATGLTNTILKFQDAKNNALELKASMSIANDLGKTDLNSADTQMLIDMKKQQLTLSQAMTQEEYNLTNAMIKERSVLQDQAVDLEEKRKKIQQQYSEAESYYNTYRDKTWGGKGTLNENSSQAHRQEAGAHLVAIGTQLKNDTNKINEVQTAMDRLQQAQREYNNTPFGSPERAQALQKMNQEMVNAKTAISGARDKMKEWIDTGKVQGAEATRIRGALNNLRDINLENAKGQRKVNLAISEGVEVGQKASATASQMGQNLKKTDSALQQNEAAIKQNEAAVTSLNQRWQAFFKEIGIRAQIQNFSTMIGKVGQLASAINMLANIPSIFNDESLSAGEKFLRITMAITTAIPMGIAAITGMSTAYTGLKNAITASIAMSNLQYLFDEQKQRQDLESIGIKQGMSAAATLEAIAKKLGIQLTKEESASLTANLLIRKLEELQAKKGKLSKTQEIALRFLNKLAIEGENVSIMKTIGLLLKEQAIRIATNPVILATVAAMALLVAITGSLLATEDAREKKLQETKKASEEAAKQAKALSERYRELADKVKEFKEAISDYESGVSELEKLTKGTKEYADALEEANAKATELIEKYDLFGKYHIDENGLIVIDEGAVEEAQNQFTSEANTAQRRMYGANITEQQAKKDAALAQIQYEVGDIEVEYQATVDKEETNTKSDTLAGTDLLNQDDSEPEETESHTYTRTRSLTDRETDALVKAFENMTLENLESYNGNKEAFLSDQIEKTDLYDDEKEALLQNIDAILENEEVFTRLAGTVTTADTATSDYAKKIMGMAVKDEYGEKIKEMSAGDTGKEALLTSVVAQKKAQNDAVDGENLDQEMAKVKDDTAHISTTRELENYLGGLGVADQYKVNNDEELALTYAEMLGYGDRDTLTYKKGDGKGTVVDAQGNKVIDGMSDEVMRREIARQAAYDQISKKFTEEGKGKEDDFIEVLDTLMQNSEAGGAEFGTDFSSVILESMANGDIAKDGLDFSSIIGKLDPAEFAKLQDKEMTAEDIARLFGLTGEEIQKLTGMTAEEFAEKFQGDLKEQYSVEAYNTAADQAGVSEAAKYEIDTEEFEIYRDILLETNPELENHREELNKVAIMNMRMERGVKKVAENWEDWGKTLKDTDADAVDTAKALTAIKEPLDDIIGFSDEDLALLPKDFAKDNIELIDDVTNGVEGSVEKLREAAANEIRSIKGQDAILEMDTKIDVDIDKDGVLDQAFLDLNNKIAEFNASQFPVGVPIEVKGQEEFYAACNEMINAAGMTAQDAQNYFAQMGYDAEIVEVDAPEKETPWHIENPILDKEATELSGVPVFTGKTVLTGTNKSPGGKALAVKTITPTGEFGGNVGLKKTPAPTSTAPRTGKGGGGGGDKKPEKIDKMESEIDRYHDVENELKKLNTLLERQERIASKLTGKDRIAAIQKQISLLQEQNEKQKEKLKLMQEEAEELKKKLQGEGVRFDAEGDISNYKALLKAKEDEINNMIDEANSKSSADAQEKIKEDIENAKEEYEKLREWIERYEELIYDEMPGLEDEMQEAWDKQIELQIEAFEIEIQLKLDLQDTKRQLNEFMREVIEGIEDDEYGKIQEYIAKDLPTYFGETGTAQANYDALQKALEEYQTIKNGGIGEIFGDDANAAWEKVMELKDETLDSLSEVKDLIDEMEENYLNAIEAASEEFAKHLEQYEQIQSILDHNIKLIEMLAGDEAYDAQLAYYKQMERNNLGQVDEARRVLEFWRQQKAAAEEGSEAWKEANAKEQEAQEQLNALVEQSVETIKTKYEKTVSKIIKDLNNAVTSGKGLDALSQEWELINQEADMYLDTVNSAYEIQKLENKLIDAIDNASSLKAKQRLNELMEKELGMLKDKDKLSQYEVDRANQLLDIEMKKIALEEAQRNKSTMRLRRDAQGNYSYQYVTDNDAVAKAQEELNEAQNSLFNLDKDAYKENLDQILSLWTDFQTKLNEIWTNNNLTDEQKQQQAYELRERYMRMISGLTQDNENIRLNLEVSTFSELARLRNMDIQDFQNMADEQKKILLEQIIPQWSSGLQSLAEQFKDENGFTSLMNQAFKDLQTNLANYQKSLKDLEKNAGIKFEKIISGAEDYSKEIQNLINKNKTIVNDQSEILKGIRDSIDATKEWVEEFNKLAKAAKETLDTIIQIQEKENKKDTSNANSSKNNKSEDKKDSSSNKDNSSGGDGKLTTGETVTYTGGPYYETSDGGGKSDSRGPGKKVTVTRISKGEKYPIQVKSDDSASGWLKEDQLTGYGTGGYTGDWSSRDGRLAVLHEKELVLNKQDTQNILAAVDMVRSLNNSLTSRIANLFNHSSVDKLIQLFEKDSAPLEQNVQITASFPNVSAEREIEEAFNSLISSASQYAFNTLK